MAEAFFRTEIYFHEARMNGGTILLPCLNKSEGLTTIFGNSIYIGLRFITGLEIESINNILLDRYQYGDFEDLRDFVKRVPISLDQLQLLIRIGAFRFIGKSKKELLWDAHFLLNDTKKTTSSVTLFDIKVKEFNIPELWSHPLQDAFDEIELIGFPVSITPFELLEDVPNLP